MPTTTAPSPLISPPETPAADRFEDQRRELLTALDQVDRMQAAWPCDGATGEQLWLISELTAAVKVATFDQKTFDER
jgi:hypothetical protein